MLTKPASTVKRGTDIKEHGSRKVRYFKVADSKAIILHRTGLVLLEVRMLRCLSQDEPQAPAQVCRRVQYQAEVRESYTIVQVDCTIRGLA